MLTAPIAADLPESLSIAVDLPAPVRAAPEDELAVAIDDVTGRPRTASPATVPAPPRSTSSPARWSQQDAAAAPGELDRRAGCHRTPRRGRRCTAAGTGSAARSRDTPEPAAMLTADRCSTPEAQARPRPEGGWNEFVYVGDLRAGEPGRLREGAGTQGLDRAHRQDVRGRHPVRARCSPARAASARPPSPTLLGMALADTREDRIIAIDANPDRGTLAERVSKQTRSTVRDVVTQGRVDHQLQRLHAAGLARRDPAGHPRVRHRPAAVRGVRRERLQRRRRPHRPVLLDRAHRLRHRHRALGDAGDAAARRLGGRSSPAAASTRRGWPPRR